LWRLRHNTAKIRYAELRIAHTELREQLTAGHVTDLPNPPRRVN
jgi:hypothetical protein